ncbi:MAG TPA: M3 family peptidase, partial [Trueperaceae bacterium]|nr:M3 family peptidase [Trueperaceae bacterium]
MNPILSQEFKIPFAKIDAADIKTAIPEVLLSTKQKINELIQSQEPASYQNTIVALEASLEPLNRAVTIVYHLKGVKNTPEIRQAFNAVLEDISSFYASLGLNQDLWQRLKEFANSPDSDKLEGIEKRHFEKTIKSFKRSGADLDEQARAKIKAIRVELSELQNKFSENVLDSSNQFEMILNDPDELSGLPDSVLQMAKEDAERKSLSGYRFSLQAPYYVPFLKYADNRELRKKMHQAYANRASFGQYDNEALIDKILVLRQELAKTLGYENFAEYQLEERMLSSAKKVRKFQSELYNKTYPFWQKEIKDLKEFSKNQLKINKLEAWDVAYAIEKLKLSKFSFDGEELRPYFSLDSAQRGLFSIANKLFGIR